MGRRFIGIDINPETILAAGLKLKRKAARIKTVCLPVPEYSLFRADSTSELEVCLPLREAFTRMGRRRADLLMLHPPYHNIVPFSENPQDLSQCASVEAFLKMFRSAVDLAVSFLEHDHFAALVIGDIYVNSQVVPLGFQCMEVMQKAGLRLKGICVKNITNNRAKRQQANLWRQRAFRGNFYTFDHEYIFVFQNTKAKGNARRVSAKGAKP